MLIPFPLFVNTLTMRLIHMHMGDIVYGSGNIIKVECMAQYGKLLGTRLIVGSRVTKRPIVGHLKLGVFSAQRKIQTPIDVWFIDSLGQSQEDQRIIDLSNLQNNSLWPRFLFGCSP